MEEPFKGQFGFSLIELILVISLIGILMVVVFPQWPVKTIDLDAQVAQLANDVRYTQSLAMTRGQRFYLIKTSNTSYEIRNSQGTAILLPTGGTSMTWAGGTQFGSFTQLPNDLIAFNGEGVPYITTNSPGTPLTTPGILRLINGSSTRTITIQPETGKVD